MSFYPVMLMKSSATNICTAMFSVIILMHSQSVQSNDDISIESSLDDLKLRINDVKSNQRADFIILEPESHQQKLELDLKVAQASFDAAPNREESYIWLGRRYGYLQQYDKAIEIFTAGLLKFPDSYKLLRFRARHLARNREFSRAIEDYKMGLQKMKGKADSFEPDGIKNSINLPISTYRRNLHYYLGQTSFATGDYIQMFEQLEESKKSLIDLPFDDHKVAVTFWQYIALKKLAKNRDAEVLIQELNEPLILLENKIYHDALLILTGRVDENAAKASQNNLAKFALGMKVLFEGNEEYSNTILRRLIKESPNGFWPAEVALGN